MESPLGFLEVWGAGLGERSGVSSWPGAGRKNRLRGLRAQKWCIRMRGVHTGLRAPAAGLTRLCWALSGMDAQEGGWPGWGWPGGSRPPGDGEGDPTPPRGREEEHPAGGAPRGAAPPFSPLTASAGTEA